MVILKRLQRIGLTITYMQPYNNEYRGTHYDNEHVIHTITLNINIQIVTLYLK